VILKFVFGNSNTDSGWHQSVYLCGLAKGERALEAAVFWLLVHAEAEEDGCAHLHAAALGIALMSPFSELDLRDEFGAHEVDASRGADGVREWVSTGLAAFELLPHSGVRLGSESATGLADV